MSATGVFAPRPGAAPVGRQVLAQVSMEARLMLRNGEQVLLAVIIPVVVLVGAVRGAERVGIALDAPAPNVFTPGVLALAVMSTSFTSLAIATGFERRYGVLKRLGSAPLSRTALLAGKVGALLVIELVQLAVLVPVGLLLGWRPGAGPVDVVLAAAALLLGTSAFAALGLFVAGVLRAEATLAAANLVYLLLLAGGAVVLPASAYGGFGDVARWLPSGALGEAMRATIGGAAGTADGGALAVHLLVLAAWTAVGAVLTARTFTWE